MKSLTEQLAEIKERCDKATEILVPISEPGTYSQISPGNDDYDWSVHEEFSVTEDDCELLKASKSDVPKLLAVIEKLIQQRERCMMSVPLSGTSEERYRNEFNTELSKILEGAE